ncbi:MAG: citrate synthase [Gammaproteobacteria bacterium]|nr:MAG: citrate synthase [Gammaproteobacteria bacterium]
MTQEHKHEPVRSRNEPFVARTATRIWHEEPSTDNPYIAASAQCHGYDLFELMEKRSFVDVFYLLFRGELPSHAESNLLQQLMIALINPGPRHPAVRAAMNVGVGKTDPLHILPIASAVLGGTYLGGGELETSMRFFRKHQKTQPEILIRDYLEQRDKNTLEKSAGKINEPGEVYFAGFGARNGGVELMAVELASRLAKLDGAGAALQWGCKLNEQLDEHGQGWLMTGVAAAVFADLGFQPRAGGCLFQLLGAPGLVAQGLELANKPITAMPFVSDENYVIER